MTDNRTRLLDAAVTEIAERGPDRATVAAIARRAGLTTGALYARWPGKRDLLNDVRLYASAGSPGAQNCRSRTTSNPLGPPPPTTTIP